MVTRSDNTIMRMCRWQKAFTLVELVTVIAVIGILVGIASPRFMGAETFNTRGDTGVIASTLRYAQKTAITQHQDIYFLINLSTRIVRLCYDVGCSTAVIDPSTTAAFSQALSTSVIVATSDLNGDGVSATLGFDALGRPKNSAGALITNNRTFTVANAKNPAQSTVITIEAESGYVH